ncbi:MAG: hypothetical protein IPN88_17590 [Bacteroidetes bacterium]|nr:hypothetical protein [Bacteroidota bacterium]
MKLDSLGALVWNNCYGGTSKESAYSIQQTFDDGYIVAGGLLDRWRCSRQSW